MAPPGERSTTARFYVQVQNALGTGKGNDELPAAVESLDRG